MSSVSYISSSTTAATSAASSTSTTTSTDSADDVKGTFLQLLLTQLENQNPLDPVDTTEFTNQLVSYSSLEQQINTNTKLDSLLSQLSSNSYSSAFSYIGAEVDADTNASVLQDGEAKWSYTLGDDSSSVTLKVTDADGNTIGSYSLGSASAGTYSFDLVASDDGLTLDDGTPVYLSVTATDSSGDSVDTAVSSTFTVDGVSTDSDGNLTLNAGNLSIPGDDVISMSKSTSA